MDGLLFDGGYAADVPLSSILAAEKEAILSGAPLLGMPSALDPTIDDLRAVLRSTKRREERAVEEDWEPISRARALGAAHHDVAASSALMVQRALSSHPGVVKKHLAATATELTMSARAADPRRMGGARDSHRARSAQNCRAGMGVAPADAAPPADFESANLRSMGAVPYDVTKPPGRSGFEQACRSCHSRGGRLSAVSIPSQTVSKAALENTRKLASAPVDPEYVPGPTLSPSLPCAALSLARSLPCAALLHSSPLHARTQDVRRRARLLDAAARPVPRTEASAAGEGADADGAGTRHPHLTSPDLT